MTSGSANRCALTRPASIAANSDAHWLSCSPSRSTIHQLPDLARRTWTAKVWLSSAPDGAGVLGTSAHGVDESEPLAGAGLLGPYRGATDPDVLVQHGLPDEVRLERDVRQAQLE